MVLESKMPFQGGTTYFRIVNPEGKKTPLLYLHGGPGSTHNYFEVLDPISYDDDRPFIMYDQIGCGGSYIDGDASLFNAQVWLDELETLRSHLQLDELHILGQSWGGMLAILYALQRNPKGVRSYILSSTLSSAKLWQQEQHRRIRLMDEEVQKALFEAEEKDDYTSKEYEMALDAFMIRYCSGPITEDSPEPLRRKKVSGQKAYVTGWGKNEFTPTGTLSGYEVTDQLHQITTPVLVTNGQEDLSSPYIAKTIVDALPNATWELFAESRHMPFVDEYEKYAHVLKQWMNQIDEKW